MAVTQVDVARGLESRQCAHCQLPLPARAHREMHGTTTLLFCCVGCVLVFRLIGHSGEGGRADWFLAKLGLAALLSGNIMMFQSLTYFGSLESLGTEVVRTSSWIMFVCALTVFVLLGVPMLRIAVRGLFRGRLTLETLIGFGTLAAIGFSGAETLRGSHQLYYDSGTMVLVFVSLGQYLDAEARRRAMSLLLPTLDRSRRAARIFRDGVELQLAPNEVLAGELVYVRAGEQIPVDGTVSAGTCDIHEPLLTGEWQPRFITAGHRVSAGSTAIDGALTVRASGGTETVAERVARFAIEARDRRAPIEAVVDRIITWFIPAVLLIAMGSCCAWGLAGNWIRGLQSALAVLVVACPCALGIATPMATTIALTMAIGRGCLVRSGAVLEALSRVRVLALDKTGTLTCGRPVIVRQIATEGAAFAVDESLRLAAAVEREVTHPFARTLVQAAHDRGITIPTAVGVRATAGGGACGEVERHRVAVGKSSWLTACGIDLTPSTPQNVAGSSVWIAIDGRLTATLLLDDPSRPEALQAVRTLRVMDIACHLLSGDRNDVVAKLASTLGCDQAFGELSPTDKPLHVRALRPVYGLIAMVGDGINDAPALGAADVGIAFGPAADLAKETADVTILREDLREVPDLIGLARKTMRIVRQNLGFAFAYNAIAVAIAACGLLRPVFAAAAMVLSSICVINNSMRLRRMGRSIDSEDIKS